MERGADPQAALGPIRARAREALAGARAARTFSGMAGDLRVVETLPSGAVRAELRRIAAALS